MRIVCWHTILMKYHFFWKFQKMLQSLSSAAVIIGALRVKVIITITAQTSLSIFPKQNTEVDED